MGGCWMGGCWTGGSTTGGSVDGPGSSFGGWTMGAGWGSEVPSVPQAQTSSKDRKGNKRAFFITGGGEQAMCPGGVGKRDGRLPSPVAGSGVSDASWPSRASAPRAT